MSVVDCLVDFVVSGCSGVGVDAVSTCILRTVRSIQNEVDLARVLDRSVGV